MDATRHSPFFKVRKALLVLRWTLGFPLQIKDDCYTEFRCVVWLECLRFVIYCLMLCNYFFYVIAACLLVDGTLEHVITTLKDVNGLISASSVDQASLTAYQICVVLLSFAYIILFKINAHEITSICKQMSDLKTRMTTTDQKIKVKKKMCKVFKGFRL